MQTVIAPSLGVLNAFTLPWPLYPCCLTKALEAARVMTRPEPKDIKSVVVDNFREWPKEIKEVGRDYWVEVMAAAKKLLTPYRYKALRQTMLGVFRYKKGVPEPEGIEVQDIRDALTATHEQSHNMEKAETAMCRGHKIPIRDYFIA
jgi:hypothetical protein